MMSWRSRHQSSQLFSVGKSGDLAKDFIQSVKCGKKNNTVNVISPSTGSTFQSTNQIWGTSLQFMSSLGLEPCMVKYLNISFILLLYYY